MQQEETATFGTQRLIFSVKNAMGFPTLFLRYTDVLWYLPQSKNNHDSKNKYHLFTPNNAWKFNWKIAI